MNRLIIKGTTITEKDIESGSNFTSHAMAGETLAADQISCIVNTGAVPFCPADHDEPLITADDHACFVRKAIYPTAFNDGDQVLYFDGDALAGKYFFESVVRQGPDRYKITAVSIVGRLLHSRHYGGIYTGVPASQIFADILAGTSYVLDPDVASATVIGYLPIAIRRDNLQQLLIATGATLRVDDAGTLYITSMSPVQTGTFADNRVFIGGSVKIDTPIAGVKVTEHNYFEAGNVVTLFSDGVDGEELIEFREPYHGLAIQGGTIVESGANYARISAKGTVTLTGKPYTHVTRVVTAGAVGNGSTENVKTVSSCYLANPQIAQSIADRLYEYLKCNRTITQDVLTGTERAGDVVSVINPYTMEMEKATIKRFDVTMSAVNRASAEFLVGFVPSGVISGFKSHALLTDSGSWTVPAGVTKIRVIVVGAGSGGGGGKDGSAGSDGSWSNGTGSSSSGAGGTPTGGSGGAGGSAGKTGTGGQVFEISLDVTPGQVFSFACGTGGAGGAANGGEGKAGGATTFGSYSSTYGRKYPYGYVESKTGLTFATDGEAGFDGGRGGTATSKHGVPAWGEYYYGEDGEDVNGFSGGAGALSRRVWSGPDDRNTDDYYGAGGGGAANGANGGAANNTGTGGNGATGKAGANATNYGQGGGAGNGGGGGGGGGLHTYYSAVGSNPTNYSVCPGGAAGKGAAGGNGGNGCIVVYY